MYGLRPSILQANIIYSFFLNSEIHRIISHSFSNLLHHVWLVMASYLSILQPTQFICCLFSQKCTISFPTQFQIYCIMYGLRPSILQANIIYSFFLNSEIHRIISHSFSNLLHHVWLVMASYLSILKPTQFICCLFSQKCTISSPTQFQIYCIMYGLRPSILQANIIYPFFLNSEIHRIISHSFSNLLHHVWLVIASYLSILQPTQFICCLFSQKCTISFPTQFQIYCIDSTSQYNLLILSQLRNPPYHFPLIFEFVTSCMARDCIISIYSTTYTIYLLFLHSEIHHIIPHYLSNLFHYADFASLLFC